MKNRVFDFNGNKITFRYEGDSLMVNATQMAKLYNKRPCDWLRCKSVQKLIDELSGIYKIPKFELVWTVVGGNGEQGTWMHERLAISFARWLSLDFSIWCDSRIKEMEFCK